MLRIVDDSDALSPGITVAGKYTLERVVGEGGMGVVWAARHVLTHKVCALKFLKERRAKDPKSYERLLREKLYKIKGIRHSRSSFVLRTLKKADLPLFVD